ncbi:MAG TPA: hypothetical protein ENH61_00925, partial [Methylophaga aminisulfidivorans]|nr:hypothetical protein [Methylophaga aminisulfidivorans]
MREEPRRSINTGRVSAIRGSVVDIEFSSHLPNIYAVLNACDNSIVLEVLSQLDARHVRAIALTPTQ